jgi:hypothetical protein
MKSKHRLGPFCRTDPPEDRIGIGCWPRDSHWATWNADTRKMLGEWGELSRGMASSVRVHRVRAVRDEPVTYSLAERAVPARLRASLHWFCGQLSGLPTPKGVILLRDLFGNEAQGRGLRLLLAAARQLLARGKQGLSAPMFPPTSRSSLAFDLHADLWTPEILLNVYERPASDGSGESILLSVAQLKLAMNRSGMPAAVKREVTSCLARSSGEFGFERLRQLLHSTENPWHPKLEEELQQRRWAFWFNRGEGYLLHDRRWLHGRKSIRVRSSNRRFFRLVFNNRDLADRDA